MAVVYKSNGGAVGAGWRHMLVKDDGSMHIMVDEKTGRTSEVTLRASEPAPEPDPAPVHDAAPDPAPEPSPVVLPGPIPEPVEGDELILTMGGKLILSNKVYDPPRVIEGQTLTKVRLSNVTGLTFKGCTFKGTSTVWPEGIGVDVRGCKGIAFNGCAFANFHKALKVTQSRDTIIIRNIFTKNGGDHMIMSEVEGMLIEDNDFLEHYSDPNNKTHRDNIQMHAANAVIASRDVTIRNNRIVMGDGPWAQSIFMRNEAVDRDGKDLRYQNILIEGNYINNRQTHGITVGETDGLIVRNNTLEQAEGNPDLPQNQTQNPKTRVMKIRVGRNAVLENNTAEVIYTN